MLFGISEFERKQINLDRELEDGKRESKRLLDATGGIGKVARSITKTVRVSSGMERWRSGFLEESLLVVGGAVAEVGALLKSIERADIFAVTAAVPY